MPCPTYRKCRLTCGHREMVRDYREERERQETAVEQQTELERDEFDIITFKQWITGRRAA